MNKLSLNTLKEKGVEGIVSDILLETISGGNQDDCHNDDQYDGDVLTETYY
ncbi:MAG TPA: hypothetical protein VFS71_17675 [Flavobacterium sp.]|uniref:hypothetical protein n=1 Tax=Flavobacterium sp. TaxID=239 RepID=UPI002DB6AF17|nr:hypothetical protein [Flavobacterium sp.]HEU4791522.1 hypothetical protein [Flavobacterium sp.]